jgi:hypothetical protein
MIRFSCSYDGSWTHLSAPRGLLSVSPAINGGFQISRDGRIVEDGFENRDAAIAQAAWLLTDA